MDNTRTNQLLELLCAEVEIVILQLAFQNLDGKVSAENGERADQLWLECKRKRQELGLT
jgi:hypothetical protein